MLPFFPYPFLAGCALLLLLLIRTWRRNHSPWQIFFLGLFGFYLMGALRETLFPIPLLNDWRSPASFILSHINLRPFYFGGLFGLYPNIARLEIFGNILLTIPYGFLLSLAARFKPRRLPWLLLAGGLGFELVQLTLNLALGGGFRSVDINDVILNTTGALVGYGWFRLFGLMIRLLPVKAGKAPASLRTYVQQTLNRH